MAKQIAKDDASRIKHLCKTVRSGKRRAVSHLLNKKWLPPLINRLDKRGSAPLHHAIKRGDLKIVDQLLVAGADPNLANKKGCPALALAVRHEQSAILQRLLSAGADVGAITRMLHSDPSFRPFKDLLDDAMYEEATSLAVRTFMDNLDHELPESELISLGLEKADTFIDAVQEGLHASTADPNNS
ncbi:MAG: ankyrin repeat domain-containing protein [Magnetococcales bacterium]|nr:ankyrin repeat domain-containing protein [Magnetococcales bacterium]